MTIQLQNKDVVKPLPTLKDHVFECWRKGLKTTKIIESYHCDVSEKDVNDKFKFILNEYFEGLNNGTN